jgi:hypothetical protein
MTDKKTNDTTAPMDSWAMACSLLVGAGQTECRVAPTGLSLIME